jgi:hypothetical protein
LRKPEFEESHSTSFLSYRKESYSVRLQQNLERSLDPIFVREYNSLPQPYAANHLHWWRFIRKYGCQFYRRFTITIFTHLTIFFSTFHRRQAQMHCLLSFSAILGGQLTFVAAMEKRKNRTTFAAPLSADFLLSPISTILSDITHRAETDKVRTHVIAIGGDFSMNKSLDSWAET